MSALDENESQPAKLTEERRSQTTEDESVEPIEQVMSEETIETSTAKPTTELEDQERFEETAKFEEEIEPVPSVSRKRTRKIRGKSVPKLLSNLQNELRRHLYASNETDLTLKEIQRQIKNLNKRTDTKHHQIVRQLESGVRDIQKKIDRIDRSIKSTKSKPKAKKRITGKKEKKRNNRNKQITKP